MNRGCFDMAFLVLLLLFGYSLAAQEPIPQGFAAQLKAAQQARQQQAQPPQPPQEVAPQAAPQVPQLGQPAQADSAKVEEKKAEAPPPPPPPPPPKKSAYPSYEAYLDSIEFIAKSLLPARITLDSMKSVINSEFGTEKNKQLKITALEKQHEAKEKKAMDKLTSTIKLSDDIQPEWNGLLQQNEKDVSEYQKRIEKFKEKISSMNVMRTRAKSLLAKLQVDSSYIETLDKKNMLYIKRMERACELMQNYMLKEQSQVLSTERKKFDMSLGEYNAEKEEYQIKIRDIISTVPFDYQGIIKIKPRLAEIIDNETDDFTASIDYVNYPFMLDGSNVYPGAKKAHIYYENNEVVSVGTFKNIDGYDWREGYMEWALRADSLLNGKLKYRNLDSSYAMKKVRVGPPFWTGPRIFRATAFVLSAASLGLGYWQHTVLKSRTEKANSLYKETLQAAMDGNEDEHKKKANAYDNEVSSLQINQLARNGFYISAGTFGVAGIVSFFF